MAFTIPYKSIGGGLPRPHLVLHMVGLNGKEGPVIGIVDSGADTTSLPYGYASLMGYTSATLEQITFGQANGVAVGYRATVPCTGVVVGIPDVTIEMMPMFIQGSQMVLWGRQDFMTKFDVTFQETRQQFSISPVESI